MIKVTFFENVSGLICGFEVKDHSGYAEQGKDIVCAAVSSAVILTANTITEIIKAKADVTENDGLIKLNLSDCEVESCSDVLEGLKLHLLELVKQYPKNLKVKISEV